MSILNWYLFGSALSAVLFAIYAIFVNKEMRSYDLKIKIVVMFIYIILSYVGAAVLIWAILLVSFGNIKFKELDRINNLKKSPSAIPTTSDNTGFLNFNLLVKLVDDQGKEIMSRPLSLLITSFMNDYGFEKLPKPDHQYSMMIQLPTGSWAKFPYATKDAPKG